jgi:hypothetical protein
MSPASRSSRWMLTARWIGLLLLSLSFSMPVGALAQESTFTVSIVSPAEGETLYAGPTTLLYTVDVRGWVAGADDPAQVSLQLEVFQDSSLALSLFSNPAPDGSFAFPVTVNPKGSEGNFTPVEIEAFCEDCHYTAADSFPNGALLLRVTATDTTGRQTRAERHIIVDRSAYTTIPVQVVYAEDPDRPMSGITISASTWIYEWRARHAYAKTDESGIAFLNLEALSQAPTRYQLLAESSVQDGVFYEGTGAVEITIPPAGTVNRPVTLRIQQALETIGGQIRFFGSDVPQPLELWAVRVRDEAGFQTSVDDFGRFTFSDLPLGRYIIAADPAWLAELGWRVEHQIIELTADPEAGIKLTATALDGGIATGQLVDGSGSLIPFGRVTVQDSSLGADVLPSSAEWQLLEAPEVPFTLTATAPGFLPTEANLDPATSSSTSIRLEQAPETRVLDWGDGRLILPGETRAVMRESTLQLDYGWLWGFGGGSGPLSVQLPNADVTIHGGSFALEIAPGQINRLFIDEGSAEVVSRATGFKSELVAGEMLDLSDPDRSVPVPQNPIVDQVMQAEYGIEMPSTYDPGEVEQRQTLLQTAAGIITLITYYLFFLVLGALPLVLIYSLVRRRLGRRDN